MTITLFSRVSAFDTQLSEYLAWRVRTYPMASRLEERWVRVFFAFVGKYDVCDVTRADCVRFMSHVRSEYNGMYTRNCARKCVGNFLSHYARKGYPCVDRRAMV